MTILPSRSRRDRADLDALRLTVDALAAQLAEINRRLGSPPAPRGKPLIGLAAMSPGKRKAIARMGGLARQAKQRVAKR